jgi:hypothetical protein
MKFLNVISININETKNYAISININETKNIATVQKEEYGEIKNRN